MLAIAINALLIAAAMIAVSDAVLITTLLIAAVPGVGAVVVSIVTAVRTKSDAAIIQTNQAETKVQVKEVHGLVNSAMTEQKRITWMFAQRVAEVTKDSKDVELANSAKKIYDDAVLAAAAAITAATPPPALKLA